MTTPARREATRMQTYRAVLRQLKAEAADQHRQELRTVEQAQANAGWAQRELRDRAGRARC